jgi:hypothetical protein
MIGSQTRPTFGQVRQYLLGLGFAEETPKSGIAAFTHADSGAVFLFHDRDPNTPARESEMYELELQLTYRGVVTEGDFRRFANSATLPAGSP